MKEDNGRCENPENAEKPERSDKSKPAPQNLADILKKEKRSRIHGGIYHKVQVELTYNSNHMESSRLTLNDSSIEGALRKLVSYGELKKEGK